MENMHIDVRVLRQCHDGGYFLIKLTQILSYQVHVEEELPHATAVPSRLSTKDVVITVV